jgi:hypothetical protein
LAPGALARRKVKCQVAQTALTVTIQFFHQSHLQAVAVVVLMVKMEAQEDRAVVLDFRPRQITQVVLVQQIKVMLVVIRIIQVIHFLQQAVAELVLSARTQLRRLLAMVALELQLQ